MNRGAQSRLMLEDVNTDAFHKYLNKEIIKGDSWRDMTVSAMHNIMMDEIEELSQVFQGGYDPDEAYQEILDVINTAKMVGARIKEDNEV